MLIVLRCLHTRAERTRSGPLRSPRGLKRTSASPVRAELRFLRPRGLRSAHQCHTNDCSACIFQFYGHFNRKLQRGSALDYGSPNDCGHSSRSPLRVRSARVCEGLNTVQLCFPSWFFLLSPPLPALQVQLA